MRGGRGKTHRKAGDSVLIFSKDGKTIGYIYRKETKNASGISGEVRSQKSEVRAQRFLIVNSLTSVF
jgi:hypothetical protein